MSEKYNPIQHSIVQAISGSWCQFECDAFLEALLAAILREIERVHWNVFQHQWGPTWHSDEVEDPEIPGIVFTRYYQDRCDCGGQFPIHTPECDVTRLHRAWNDRRLEFLSVSSEPVPGFPGMVARELDFSEKKERAFQAKDPRPKCTCGGESAFDENRGCLDACIGRRPNFKHEDVEFRWYKRPGRGMSTNKDWTPAEWKAWFDRCIATVKAFDVKHFGDEDRQRVDKLRADFELRYAKPQGGGGN